MEGSKLPLLDIKNLSVDFITEGGVFSALRDISFTVQRGEIVAIVGESGSGKSVTSLSVLQLLPSPPAVYTSGGIFFSGDGTKQSNLLTLPSGEMRKIRGNDISMIFQEPMTSLNPVYTCGSQVAEAIKLHQRISSAKARAKTLDIFEKVRLPDPPQIFRRYPHQLSGGQKQRVMIALAVSCNPSLLIADEPTTALDVTVQKTILLLIKELQQQFNMGVIFITHDLGVVSEVAGKVIVMYKGKIVEQGSVTEILRSPKHPYTKGLLACRPLLHEKGERLPVVSDFIDTGNNGDILEKNVHAYPPHVTHTRVIPTVPPTENTGNEACIKVENLHVWFPVKTKLFGSPLEYIKAVNNVSFEIYTGETLGLVGESGCGKTTLGRTLIRLIEPTAGVIIFKGRNLLHYPPDLLRRMRKDMQIIFQDPYSSLNPRLTIGNAILEPLKIHRFLKNDNQRKERVMALLEKVGLKPEHYQRYPHEFSGGQRQRIVIARALALEPSFIICDESVSSLDVSVQAQILNLLNDLKKEFQFTAVFISHDLSVVRYISDRIMVMNNGMIEETGSAEQVYHRPRKKYTQNLIHSIPGR